METAIPQDEPQKDDTWAFLDTQVFPIDGKEVSKALFELGFSTLNMKRRVSARIRKFLNNSVDHSEPFWYIDVMVNCADKCFDVTFETNFCQSKVICRQGFDSVAELTDVIRKIRLSIG
ncbi:hypothetical protein BWI97_16190, partial [Siphonobacter sp. BAB-5405]|uniref:hypothetical protein n=1 Tax=Siphonobacter sp. BAB-5405 TaxID=1864825 RepID=UPI000CCAECFD